MPHASQLYPFHSVYLPFIKLIAVCRFTHIYWVLRIRMAKCVALCRLLFVVGSFFSFKFIFKNQIKIDVHLDNEFCLIAYSSAKRFLLDVGKVIHTIICYGSTMSSKKIKK